MLLMRRRQFLGAITVLGAAIRQGDRSWAAASPEGSASDFWWFHFPTFAQIDDPQRFQQSGARMNIQGFGMDPTWGPYAQRLAELDAQHRYQAMRAQGARLICWIEGFGDCMLYAAVVQRLADGSFERRTDDPAVTRILRSHWNWADRQLPPGNTLVWVGLHNSVNDEPFVGPAFTRETRGIPFPTYPDGTPAVGWLEGVQ